jgi:hypothetical protein
MYLFRGEIGVASGVILTVWDIRIRIERGFLLRQGAGVPTMPHVYFWSGDETAVVAATAVETTTNNYDSNCSADGGGDNNK